MSAYVISAIRIKTRIQLAALVMQRQSLEPTFFGNLKLNKHLNLETEGNVNK